MTSRQTYKTPNRSITVSRGAEGPRHDPYSYTEIKIEHRYLPEAIYHAGLGWWVKYNGATLPFKNEGEGRIWFETVLGCSLRTFQRACERIHSRCRECGGPVVRSVEGYPGESLNLCAQGHVVSGDFNESAIL